MEKTIYDTFLQEAGRFIPKDRIYTDRLRRLAWGTDAGFYRLIPQAVIRSKDEDEVSRLLTLAATICPSPSARQAPACPDRPSATPSSSWRANTGRNTRYLPTVNG